MNFFLDMDNLLFGKQHRLADMITACPGLLLTFQRLNIPLGFGDKTVAEVCAKHGVDPDFFLLICNVQAHDDYVPALETVASTDMSGLVPYLKACHRYYTCKRLPHIANHIDRIAQQLPTTRVRKAFEAFFKAYLIEIELHFTDEEQNVYPCILALQQGQRGKGRINDFIALHGNLQDKLDDLTQIIFKYLPASVTGDDPIDAVLDILQLSQDLKKHNLIEEKIMIPYVKWIEKKVK